MPRLVLVELDGPHGCVICYDRPGLPASRLDARSHAPGQVHEERAESVILLTQFAVHHWEVGLPCVNRNLVYELLGDEVAQALAYRVAIRMSVGRPLGIAGPPRLRARRVGVHSARDAQSVPASLVGANENAAGQLALVPLLPN
ncbi:MAG: hypothetical protein F4191_06145 [Rhodothermaceae bacterium]|nr:hypothetical protein [Rhodothermaceae bacterium]